jgi:hypothetical protein
VLTDALHVDAVADAMRAVAGVTAVSVAAAGPAAALVAGAS